ncbi:MAG TPA: YbhN family protein [Phycisphaerales bacterium]|nr:YbhN family protein [Phycisphaerales bacterium]
MDAPATIAGPAVPAAPGRAPTARRAGPMIRVALHVLVPLAVAVLVYWQVRDMDLRQVVALARGADTRLLALGVGAAGAAVLTMGFYDVLCFAPALTGPRRWRLGAMIFAWTNFLTLGPLGGPALRLHFYRKAGLTAAQVAGGVARQYIGFGAGVGAWLAMALLPLGDGAPALAARVAGALALAPLGALIAARLAFRHRRVAAHRAGARTMALLGLVGAVDWGFTLVCFLCTAGAAGISLPASEQLRALMLGHFAGILSFVPGGVGAADATWLHFMERGGVKAEAAGAAVLLFRLAFYVLPWVGALLALKLLFAGRSVRAALGARASGAGVESRPGTPGQK